MNTAPNTGKLTLPGTKEELTEQERIRRGLLADGRPRKAGYGQAEQKLAWPEIPGFRLFWANDEPGRVADLLEKGYSHVEKDGKPVSRVVGKGQMGGGLIAYLLKIPMEWYNEDVLGAQAREDEKMQRIREGKVNPSAENQYVPAQGIKVVRTANPERR